MSTHETLGLLLVRDGHISRTQLYDALRLQRQNNRLLGTCLLSLGYIRPDVLLEMLSRQLSVPALAPGTLNRAQPAAVAKVPPDVALRLRILPYSWDGTMLGVAVSDGRVLEQLHEVAYHARCAVGAYVALELEIDAALRSLYPGMTRSDVMRDVPTAPAPAVAPSQQQQQHQAPTLLQNIKVPVKAPERPAEPPPVITAAPPPAAGVANADLKLQRQKLSDAIEQVYAATDAAGIGQICGRALLNYFSRVVVAVLGGEQLRLVGVAEVSPRRIEVPTSAMPLLTKRSGDGDKRFTYGQSALEPKAGEFCGVLGIPPGTTAFLAVVGADPVRLVLLADNGDSPELYEELHDVEMLCKEAETALRMLKGS